MADFDRPAGRCDVLLNERRRGHVLDALFGERLRAYQLQLGGKDSGRSSIVH